MRYLKIAQNKSRTSLPTMIVSTDSGIKYKDMDGENRVQKDSTMFDRDRINNNHTEFILILDKGEEIV